MRYLVHFMLYSVAASMWTLTKFSYSSFGVSVSDISSSASNLFFTFIANMPIVKQGTVIVQLWLFAQNSCVGSNVCLS